ncbi:MAG: hypothetical protein IPI33_16525 [Dehalococcoidia bacterium]|nr:hypothetical protein [Dehalococcoidia bacterium]
MLVELSVSRPVYLVVMGFTEFIEPGTPWIGDAQVWVLRLRGGSGEYRLASIANPTGGGSIGVRIPRGIPGGRALS